MSEIRKAVIPVAGRGTRFLPATKVLPKEMFPIINKPVLMYIIEECMLSGITEILLIISKDKDCIKKFFKKDNKLEKWLLKNNKTGYLDEWNTILSKVNISFAYQSSKKIGSGGALTVAERWVNNEPFAVLFGDDLNFTKIDERPVIGQLIDEYDKYKKTIIGCKKINKEDICKYSSIVTGKKQGKCIEANGIIEKPKKGTEPSLISGLARYILPKNAFSYLKETPEMLNGEIALTDTLNIICKKEGALAYVFDSIRYDTGDQLGYAQCIVEYMLRDEKMGKEFEKYLKTLINSRK
ncbi:MAG: UTP--glucose-1-phosphate uridylyltransferase [Clostridia bacterium]